MEIEIVCINVLFYIIYFLAWIIVHFMCEYKYFWCKGKCQKCHNWQCRFFKTGKK